MKKCGKCLKEQNIINFNKKTKSKDGYDNICKCCQSNYSKLRYINDREKVLNQCNNWRNKNKTQANKISSDYYYKNKEKLNKKHKKYVEDNKEDRNKYWREYQNARWKNDPQYKIQKTLRKHIYIYLKNMDVSKNQKTFNLLGYTPQDYINKIGKLNENEHIDHKIPISWFKNHAPISLIWSLDNLQNIKAEENWKKNNYFSHEISSEFYEKIKEYIKIEYIDKIKLLQ